MDRFEYVSKVQFAAEEREEAEAEAARQASGLDMSAGPAGGGAVGRGMEVALPGGLAQGAVQAQAGGPEAGE
jgi:hypothetical protein